MYTYRIPVIDCWVILPNHPVNLDRMSVAASITQDLAEGNWSS